MSINKSFKLLGSILVCQLAGIIGSLFIASGSWYQQLNKPDFQPPGWIFGPVWIMLYTLMGISLYLVIVKDVEFKDKKIALALFFIQLILNTSWSIVFFGMKSIIGGYLVIVFLWIFILLTMLKFYKISKISAVLLIPYILWVSFAAVLNYSIWRLN